MSDNQRPADKPEDQAVFVNDAQNNSDNENGRNRSRAASSLKRRGGDNGDDSVHNSRTTSGIVRRDGGSRMGAVYDGPDPEEAPKKTRSALQKLGIAPIFGHEEYPDVPRSPTGALRTHSGLTQKIVTKRQSSIKPGKDGKPTKPEEEEEVEEGDPWHLWTPEELYAKLECKDGEAGLTSAEVEARLLVYGKNLITPPPTTHWLIRLLLLFVGGFQVMMLGGGALCFIVYGISGAEDVQSLALGIVLIAVVLVSGLFQHFQEGKADKVMESLRALTAESVYAFRDGELKLVPAESLVPGDIIKVNSGEKVPADIRILSATDLKVNNAPLTGENIDIKLSREAGHIRMYESKNIARSGCNFTSGNGVAVVFCTGDNTFFGHIAKSATAVSHPDTLMKREIRRLILIMACVAVFLGSLFFLLSMLNGYTVIESIIFFIGICVANVPEGLLPQLTVALSLTARRLKEEGVLVSNLEIIETLGAVSVICSDKTGTLTCNRMTVAHIVYDGKIFLADEDSPQNTGDNFTVFDRTHDTFAKLHNAVALNTDAIFLDNDEDVLKRTTKGDASESAMIKFVQPLRDITEHRTANKRITSIPFNSSNKWMLSINEQEGETEAERNEKPLLLLIKGAPERVLAMCSAVQWEGKAVAMDDAMVAKMEALNLNLGKRGERVIAAAYAELDRSLFPSDFVFETDPPNFPTGGLTMLGYVAMIDPPRPSVRGAIEQCHSAGVKVIMVTGDHPITARSIAKSLNMITKKTKEELIEEGLPVPEGFHDAIVVHGQEMEKYTQDDWDNVLEHDEIVFARTMPQQKQEIVHQLAALGHVVAMTGDGVNDAPALKAAHVGIAMYSGASVAKEAAQLVLLNDDFGAIVQGVCEGRLIFDNLKKCICYVLSSNVPEILPFLLFIAFKIPLGIETIVILSIDLGTDLAPAVALAFEGPEDSIMQRPPRSPDQHLVGIQLMLMAYGTLGLFITFAAYFAFSWVFIDAGFALEDLLDSGEGFRGKYSDLDDERKEYFAELCLKNAKYLATGGDCNDDWQVYRNKILGQAQGAFFATVGWAQIGNALIRKTTAASILPPSRFFGNRFLLWSFVSEIAIVAALIYIPGLNSAFMLSPTDAKHIFCCMWVLPFLLVWEEGRKVLARRDLRGYWNLYTGF